MKAVLALCLTALATPVLAVEDSFILVYGCGIERFCEIQDRSALDQEILAAKPGAERALNLSCAVFELDWERDPQLLLDLEAYAEQIRMQGGETCVSRP